MVPVSLPRLLVVDKSIFHSLCGSEEKLCAFMRDYNVVLPNALAVECLISENQERDKDPAELVRRFHRAIKAGAKYGYSSDKLFQAEKRTLCPVKSVIDEASTEQFRNGTPNTTADFIKREADSCRKAFEPTIESVLKIARALYGNLCKQKELSEKLREEKDRTRRFETWIQHTDRSIAAIMKALFSEQISSRADAGWFTWQRARLYLAYCLDWVFKKNVPGSSEKRDISNDVYDIEYVAYLSRADGLLTNDRRLQVPLAEAAFPQKDVRVVNTSDDVQEVFRDIISTVPPGYRIQ